MIISIINFPQRANAMTQIFVSLSKKSKGEKSPRSRFLSILMKQFGGDAGQGAVEAFSNKDPEALRKVFVKVAENISATFSDGESK